MIEIIVKFNFIKIKKIKIKNFCYGTMSTE